MSEPIDYDHNDEDGAIRVKIICLGDSAVGKSKYVCFIFLIIFRYIFKLDIIL